ncbi:alpha/beta hydrolase, partial [Kitasatospora sp. P5_F3]
LYRPPRTQGGRTPADKGLDWQDTGIDTRDGRRLAAWLVPGDGPHTVVVCHPVGRDRSGVLPHIRLLHDAGHHVLAYDLRNHGASDDDPDVRAMADKFTSDLHDALAHVRALPDARRGAVGVLALSFSTWPAVYGLGGPGGPDAVVCDSGPGADVPAAIRRYFDLQARLLPRYLRARPARALAGRVFVRTVGRRLRVRRDWLAALSGTDLPLLFVAAARDTLVPPSEIEAVAAGTPGARVWTAPHSIHVNAHRLDRVEYARQLTAFYADAFDRAPVTVGRTDD